MVHSFCPRLSYYLECPALSTSEMKLLQSIIDFELNHLFQIGELYRITEKKGIHTTFIVATFLLTLSPGKPSLTLCWALPCKTLHV